MNARTNTTGRVLIVETDAALGALFGDAITTHCPSVRVDVCHPADRLLIEDNAGGADVAICGCRATGGACLEMLRELTTLRGCLRVVVLVPADKPDLTDEALAAGAADALLRAPGYLDQLPLIVRRNIREARRAIVHGRRMDETMHALAEKTAEVISLRARLSVLERPAKPLPEVYVRTVRPRMVLRLADSADVVVAKSAVSRSARAA